MRGEESEERRKNEKRERERVCVCLCKREGERGWKKVCALLFIAVLSTSSTKYKKSNK